MPEFYLQAEGREPVLANQPLYLVSLEESKIEGAGGYYAPHIVIPITLQLVWQRSEYELAIYQLAPRLYVGNVSISPTTIAGLLGSALQVETLSSPRHYFQLAIPVSSYIMDHIEDPRGEKDLHLTLSLRCSVAIKSTSDRRVAGMDVANGNASLRIPRSHWVDSVLPGMGYLMKHVIEISVPTTTDLSEPFQKALKEYKDAESAFRSDNYDGVLTNCRNAINAIVSAFKLDLGGEKAEYRTRVDAFRRQHLEPRTGSTKASLVAEELTALWGPLSAPTKPGPFSADRPAAKYVLQSTANLLAYLGKIFAE